MIVSDQWAPASARARQTSGHSLLLMQTYRAPAAFAVKLAAQARQKRSHSSVGMASLTRRRGGGVGRLAAVGAVGHVVGRGGGLPASGVG